MYFAGLIAYFSIMYTGSGNKFLNSPARKVATGGVCRTNLYVDEVNEGKLVEEAIVKCWNNLILILPILIRREVKNERAVAGKL